MPERLSFADLADLQYELDQGSAHWDKLMEKGTLQALVSMAVERVSGLAGSTPAADPELETVVYGTRGESKREPVASPAAEAETAWQKEQREARNARLLKHPVPGVNILGPPDGAPGPEYVIPAAEAETCACRPGEGHYEYCPIHGVHTWVNRARPGSSVTGEATDA